MSIEYAEQIVAFIDVLGFSTLVTQSDHESLDRYYDEVDRKIQVLKDFSSDIRTLQVSDSIIFAVPAEEEPLKRLVHAIRGLQTSLFELGLLTRGSITVGELNTNIDSGRVVGRAFIQAYELEKLARFPRVLIDPKILARFDWTRGEFLSRFNSENEAQLVRKISRKMSHLFSGDLIS